MMVQECLGSCYNELPQPELVLSPEDSELSYFLWMPGVQYQPRLQKKLSELRSMSAETEPISVDEVVEEVIAKDELLLKFEAAAHNGFLDLKTAADLVRELGGTPSQADLVEYCATYGNTITYDQLKELIAVTVYSEEDSVFLENVLCGLSQDKSTLTYKHLEYILSNYGEPMVPAELAAVKAKFFPGGAPVKCSDLAAALK